MVQRAFSTAWTFLCLLLKADPGWSLLDRILKPWWYERMNENGGGKGLVGGKPAFHLPRPDPTQGCEERKRTWRLLVSIGLVGGPVLCPLGQRPYLCGHGEQFR